MPSNNRNRYQKKKKKPSLLDRIKSFFGGSKTNSKSTNRSRNTGNRRPVQRNTRRSSSTRTRTRGPELREITSSRLYVGNLAYEATEYDLEELFRGVGTVESTEVVTHSRTQRSKGFAFVEMTALEQAKRAAEQLHDTEFMGRKLVVTGAKPMEPRS